jgi:hypothetical protein
MAVRPYGLAAASMETEGAAGAPIVGSATQKREINPKSETRKAPHSAAVARVALEFAFVRRTIAAKPAMIGCAGAERGRARGESVR